MDYILFKEPDRTSKTISIISTISFLVALIIGAYSYSIHKREVTNNLFTISQALAFGNKYIMVIFFTLSFIGILYLNIYRTPREFLILRLLLLLFIYSFLISIIWITTYVNKNLHYIFAGIIFISNLIYITLLTYQYQRYLRKKKEYKTSLLDLNLMLAYASLVVMLTFGIFHPDDKSSLDDAIFASNENFTVFLTLVTILYIGYI